MMKRSNFLMLATLGCVATLGACAPEKPWLYERSSVSPAPMRLVESRHVVKKPARAMNEADIASAAKLYGRTGAGPVYVVVAYKDHGKMNDADARAKTAAIVSSLRAKGVAENDIVASNVPLDTAEPVALIAFNTLEAAGPDNCIEMPGMTRMIEEDYGDDYQVGCGVKSMMARQIADPRDLEGRAGLGGRTDADHAANVVTEQLKPGAPKEYLPSYVISELAGSGG